MGSRREKRRKARMKTRVMQHRISILSISCVIILLAMVLAVGSISLHEKNRNYKAQEATLEAQLEEEAARAEEIEALEEYVGTEEYVEDVAKEKLGLVNPNEVLFKAKP